MKVADNLHQNQKSLNILSFEKALGYHLERQDHRHQSNRQSAGHHPRYAQKALEHIIRCHSVKVISIYF